MVRPPWNAMLVLRGLRTTSHIGAVISDWAVHSCREHAHSASMKGRSREPTRERRQPPVSQTGSKALKRARTHAPAKGFPSLRNSRRQPEPLRGRSFRPWVRTPVCPRNPKNQVNIKLLFARSRDSQAALIFSEPQKGQRRGDANLSPRSEESLCTFVNIRGRFKTMWRGGPTLSVAAFRRANHTA